jgi:hypothetical protein
MEDREIDYILDMEYLSSEIKRMARDRKIRVIVGRVKSFKKEAVNLKENRHLVSYTEKEEIFKVQVEQVCVAVGFENDSLKFDDYAICSYEVENLDSGDEKE